MLEFFFFNVYMIIFYFFTYVNFMSEINKTCLTKQYKKLLLLILLEKSVFDQSILLCQQSISKSIIYKSIKFNADYKS